MLGERTEVSLLPTESPRLSHENYQDNPSPVAAPVSIPMMPNNKLQLDEEEEEEDEEASSPQEGSPLFEYSEHGRHSSETSRAFTDDPQAAGGADSSHPPVKLKLLNEDKSNFRTQIGRIGIYLLAGVIVGAVLTKIWSIPRADPNPKKLWIRTGELTDEGLGSYLTHLSDDLIVSEYLPSFTVKIAVRRGKPHLYNMGELWNNWSEKVSTRMMSVYSRPRFCELRSYVSSVDLRIATDTACNGDRTALGEIEASLENCDVIVNNQRLAQENPEKFPSVWQTGSSRLFYCAQNTIENFLCGARVVVERRAAIHLRWGDSANREAWLGAGDNRVTSSTKARTAIAQLRQACPDCEDITAYAEGASDEMCAEIKEMGASCFKEEMSDIETLCHMAGAQFFSYKGGSMGTLASVLEGKNKTIVGIPW